MATVEIAQNNHPNHIYEMFWTENFTRFLYGIKIIEERQKYQNASIKEHLKLVPLIYGHVSLYCYNLYRLLTRTSWNFVEIGFIPLFFMVILVPVNVWIDVKNMKEAFSRVVETLQLMDEIFFDYFQYRHEKRLVSVNVLLLIMFLHTIVLGPAMVVLYFVLHHSQYFISIEISLCYILGLVIYMMVLKLLTANRLDTLYQISIQQVSATTESCCWCQKERRLRKQLCEKHKIMLYSPSFSMSLWRFYILCLQFYGLDVPIKPTFVRCAE